MNHHTGEKKTDRSILLATRTHRSRDGASVAGGSEGEEALLGLLDGAAVADGVGGGEVLGDELPRAAAPDLHPHALRLAHLVVARWRRLLLVLPFLPDQPGLPDSDPSSMPLASPLL